eukprot:159288_1
MAEEEKEEKIEKDWDIIYNEFERIAAMKQERRENNDDNPFSPKIEDFNLVKMRNTELQNLLKNNRYGGRLIMMSLSKTKRSDTYDVKADDIINIGNLLKQRANKYEKELQILPKNRKDQKPIQPIIHLTLSKCLLDPLGIQQISNLWLNHISYKYLIRLNLSNIGLGYIRKTKKTATDTMRERLKSIIYLAAGLKTNKSLETLRLDQNNKIPFEGLKILLFDGILKHPTLESLSYKSNKLTIKHMEIFGAFLKQNSLLQRLYLDRNQVDSVMLHEICDGLMVNSHLKALSFRSNIIEDAGILNLANVLKENKQCNIGMIDLYSNQLSVKSGLYFGEALSENYSLTKLYLSYNNIRDKGVIGLCNGLKNNTSLWRLRLTNCGLTSACCKALGNVLETHCNIAELELEENNLVNNGNNGIVGLADGIGDAKYLKYLNLTRTYPRLEGATALAAAIKKQVINVDKLEKDIKKWILESPILKGDSDG